MSIFRQLIDKKTVKVLDLFLKNKKTLFHLNKISEEAEVPLASTFRIVNHLVSIGIVDVVIVGRMKIYKLASNDKTRELQSMLDKKIKTGKNEVE